MKTLEQMRSFFETDLIADLQTLEQQRKSILNRVTITAVVCLALGLGGGLLLSAGMESPAGLLFGLIPAVAISAIIISFMTKGYVCDFKILIIEKLIKFLEPSLLYNPKGFIEKPLFMMSKIFTTKPNCYKGDDLVTGKVGSTDIRFSELNAVHESGSGKDKSRVTVFKGLFFMADFNKHFNGKTVVLPDTAEKLFGGLGKIFQKANFFRGQLIKLEDPEFERNFVVYGDDQIEARYILSPALMARIVDFKRKTGQKIYLSFVGSKVFVAVWINRNLFEPKLFNTLLDFEPIKQYYEDLTLAIGIVEDLNLNIRIWTKQ